MTEWDERDLPIIEYFGAAESNGLASISTPQLAKSLGLEVRDVRIGVDALKEARYIDWSDRARYITDHDVLLKPRLRERGRRAIGQWPADGYAALVAVLEARIASTTDRAERGKLEKFRDGLVGMGRDVATDLLSAFLRQAAGL